MFNVRLMFGWVATSESFGQSSPPSAAKVRARFKEGFSLANLVLASLLKLAHVSLFVLLD